MSGSSSKPLITRRGFLLTGACAGLGLYAGEIERHWIEITHQEILITGLPPAFNGLRVAQLSDIHMDEFTEPFFLRDAVHRINSLNPDVVFLTGDFVSWSIISDKFFKDAAQQCAGILNELKSPQRYAIFGNHDVLVGRREVAEALTANGITMLYNAFLPIERGGSRFWLAGVDDPLMGHPDLEAAIPASIRNLPNEPIILLCHEPDYADTLMKHPAGQAVALMLSGHTHGGQIRLPLIGPLILPPLGRRYIEGRFRFGTMQLYVNRGLGAVGVPFRFDCPPEITLHTLHSA